MYRDIIAKFTEEVMQEYEQTPRTFATEREKTLAFAEHAVRALVNHRWGTANAAWKALADEREKRERGMRP